MEKTRRGLFTILLSTAFLCIYINSSRISGRFENKIVNAEVLSMEEIDLLCEGKEDTFMESEIFLGGGVK